MLNGFYTLITNNLKKNINDYFDSKSLNNFYNNLVILISILFIIFVLVTFHHFDIDIKLQTIFYKHDNGWLVDRNNLFLKYVFYIIPKKIISIFSIILIIIYVITRSNFFNKNEKKIISFLLFSFAASIISVSLLKQASNMHCPDVLEHFGGEREYSKLFDSVKFSKVNTKRGKCYPAGHASAGFALLSLIFVIRNTHIKLKMLLIVLCLGWSMGLYQIAKGSHFLSDTLFTMVLCILIPATFNKIILKK